MIEMRYHNSAARNGTSYWERRKKKTEPVQKEPPLGKISHIRARSLVRVGQNLILLSPTFDPDIWKHSLSQTEGSFLFYFKYFIKEKKKTFKYLQSSLLVQTTFICALVVNSTIWNICAGNACVRTLGEREQLGETGTLFEACMGSR